LNGVASDRVRALLDPALGLELSLPFSAASTAVAGIEDKNPRMTSKALLGLTRSFLLLPPLLLGLQAGCTSRPPPDSALQRLQGTWEGVAVGGKPGEKVTIKISGDSFHFHRDSDFWFKTKIALPPGTEPQQMLATILDSASAGDTVGQVIGAIVKIEDGTLIVATKGGDGPSEQTPKGFDVTQEAGLTRFDLRKVPRPSAR
jgi:uncharacterized protein (TIGR03067 family)